MLIKDSNTTWESNTTLDDGSGISQYITATSQGLEIGGETIDWSQLDDAREQAYHDSGILNVSRSREQFEASIRKQDIKAPLIFQKWPDGSYCQNEVQNMWKGWQMALSLWRP